MTILDQLYNFYNEHEWWHEERLSKEDFFSYMSKLLDQGNIITCFDKDDLLGYCEFWRINFEQFGRIICGEPFSAVHENISNGYIAYVANTFIKPECRKTQVYKIIKDRFFEINDSCTYFVGEARRKKSAPVKVFKRSKIKEVING